VIYDIRQVRMQRESQVTLRFALDHRYALLRTSFEFRSKPNSAQKLVKNRG
jgi:hypothetical protein